MSICSSNTSNKSCSIDSQKLDDNFSVQISESDLIAQSEELTNDYRKNICDFKSLSISDSFSGQNSSTSDHIIEDNSKRIIYTKDFLMNFRLKEISCSFPTKFLPKQEETGDTFWDPEKYFDSIKGSDDDKSLNQNSRFRKQEHIDLNLENLIFNFDVIKKNYMFDPGELIDVILCSSITKNDIYVNLTSMKGAFQQLSSIINVSCNNQLISWLNLNIDRLIRENVFLAFHGNIWHRVKFISNVPNDPNCLNVFCIDNGKMFQSSFFMPCPKEFSDIPGFAINIFLAGCPKEFDTNLIKDFLQKLDRFRMKIIYFSKLKSKYYVELFNDQRISLNHVINPKFQQELFINV